jgi:hypothetical protein
MIQQEGRLRITGLESRSRSGAPRRVPCMICDEPCQSVVCYFGEVNRGVPRGLERGETLCRECGPWANSAFRTLRLIIDAEGGALAHLRRHAAAVAEAERFYRARPKTGGQDAR